VPIILTLSLAAQKMNNRFFGGRQIIAGLYDGKRRFRKTGKTGDLAEDEADVRAAPPAFAG
jgi:hypothetical protein